MATEIFPAMLDAIAGAEHTIDLLTFVYWRGRDRNGVRRGARPSGRDLVSGSGPPDAWGLTSLTEVLIDMMVGAGVRVRWFRTAAPVAADQGEPSDPSQGRWSWTRRSDSPVASVSPMSGTATLGTRRSGVTRTSGSVVRRSTASGPRSSTTGSEIDPELFDRTVDRFPEQPQAGGSGDPVRPWRIGNRCERHVDPAARSAPARGGTHPGHDRVLRARCGADRTPARRGRSGSAGRDPAPRAARGQALRAAGGSSPRISSYSGTGSSIWQFQPSMLHAKIMTVDGLVANVGSANFNARSTELDEEINLVALTAHWSDSSTISSTRTSSGARRSILADGKNAPSARRALVGLTKPLRHSLNEPGRSRARVVGV